ncbi:MAG: sigma-70 family RNA polymerase sigma factor [Lachnospiraceae bacterium]|nr:sigma-70 family RNA polymerase sigma factor [Lachnospiraceae bacterium]MDE6251767.1 sigma-70 family RNA polymerase sigma factor [Lachnospiraceae bacterium]
MTNEQIVSKIQEGENTADNMLVLWQQMKGYVYTVAARYSRYSNEHLDDLLQEGFISLYAAVAHYDSSMDSSFLNYAAYWLKQRMERYIHDNGLVRIPECTRQQVTRYKKAVSQWQQEHGYAPSESTICRVLGISSKRLKVLDKNANMGEIQSLNVKVGENDAAELWELLPADTDIEQQVTDSEFKATLWGLVDSLPDEQKELISLKYACNLKKADIIRKLGCSDSEYRRTEQKALMELRKPQNRRKLIPDWLSSGLYSRGTEWNSTTERIAVRLYDI